MQAIEAEHKDAAPDSDSVTTDIAAELRRTGGSTTTRATSTARRLALAAVMRGVHDSVGHDDPRGPTLPPPSLPAWPSAPM